MLKEKLKNPVIKIDMGAGIFNKKQPPEEWIYLDVQNLADIDIVCDFAAVPLASKSVDVIYSGDTLEHVEPWRYDEVLGEWNRLLKVGATFCGQTPNLHSVMIRYSRGELALQDAIGALYGSNELVWQHHYQTFTVLTLANLLSKYGFGEFDFFESPGNDDPNEAWWICWKCKKLNDFK